MNIDLLFENISNHQTHIDEFNRRLGVLEEKKRKMCTIHPTDSGNKIRKKCKVANIWGVHYAPVWDKYMSTNPPAEVPPTVDAGDAGGTDGGVAEIQGSGLVYPNSIGPEDDDELTSEAMSSTERVRKYYRKHPEKVRKYLKKTQKDRVARNRDRRKAVKKHGKSKMKNHDVHHPNGPNGGSWRLAKKDHGPDKKNENIEYVYLDELLEGNVPNGSWALIAEGGAAGHLAHPYEDESLSFTDVKEMIKRGLVGGLDAEAPVTEKLDGQNLTFSYKDGRVVFARNKGQVKNFGQNALDTAGIRNMFAGRGNVEQAFTRSAEDLQTAVDAMSPEEREQMFGSGRKFMNVEIIFPDTKNVIPYDKPVLVFHGTIEYNKDGEEVGRNIEDGKTLDTQLQKVNAKKQKTFGLSGPQSISFNDADTSKNLERLRDYATEISRIQQEFDLDDKSTIEDYKIKWWENALQDEIASQGLELSKKQFEGLVKRWATGDKKAIGVKEFDTPELKKWFRTFEGERLVGLQKAAARPLEKIFLRVGVDTMRRVTNFLSANNPEMAEKLKSELLAAIKNIKDAGDENQLAMLQTQIERLDDLGIDNIVPTEGIVFMYNGKPYKFTGTFAPVNQILGMMKFGRGKAKLVEPEETSTEKPTEQPQTTEPKTAELPPEKRTIAIFPGRFQPFHAGHYSIYQMLVKKFGRDNVYISTTDKTDAVKSPFGFKDKKNIMTKMFGIPDDNIVQTKLPYRPIEITEPLSNDTSVVMSFSEKDAERMAGKYFQPYEDGKDMKGYKENGYIIIAPEMQLTVNGKNISGTQVRAIMGDPNISDNAKKEIFTKIYGKFDPDIYKSVVKVTTSSEEARQLTAKHAEQPTTTKKKAKEEPKTKAGKAAPEVSDDPSNYQPGETWQTVGGNFGGKNKKNAIKYFATKEKAQTFATK